MGIAAAVAMVNVSIFHCESRGISMRSLYGFVLGLAFFATMPVVSAFGQQGRSSDSTRARNNAHVPTQHDVARMLVSDDAAKRADGLRMAQMVRPEYISRDLRFGLLIALHKESLSYKELLKARRTSGDVGLERPVSQYYDALLTRVVSLRDSVMIPALASSLGSGMIAVRALVEFGKTATNAVLRITNDPASENLQIADGLMVLRLMIENPGDRPMTQEMRRRVRDATTMRLNGKQSVDVVLRAIDLAVLLGDQDLRRTVAMLGSDPGEVRQRGIQSPADVSRVQQRARDRLAGVPAYPRS